LRNPPDPSGGGSPMVMAVRAPSVLSRKSLYIIPVAGRNGELGYGQAD
jgi:hypothetical protein